MNTPRALTAAAVCFVLLFALGCARKPDCTDNVVAAVDAQTGEVKTVDVSKLDHESGFEYIPLVIEGVSNTPEARAAYKKALGQFQEEHNVRILSWAIDKQPDVNTATVVPAVYGLTVTYEKLPRAQ